MKYKVITAIALSLLMVTGALAPAFAEMDSLPSVPEDSVYLYMNGYAATLNLIIAGAITCDNGAFIYNMISTQFGIMVEIDNLDDATLLLGQMDSIADIYNQVC